MRLIPTSRGSGQRITTKGFGMGVRLGAAFQALALVILLLALPAHATDLTGTWQGTISADGQVEDFTASFSDEGYALFDYTNNRGLVRTVELSASKRIQFVPPGGGVTTVAVESVVKRPGGLSYVLHTKGVREIARRIGVAASSVHPKAVDRGTLLAGHEPSTSTKILPSLTSYFARSSASASESTLMAACG